VPAPGLAPPATVCEALATGPGRARFWAESAKEVDGAITFHILGYEPFVERVLRREEPTAFALTNCGTESSFTLADDGAGARTWRWR